MAPASSKVVEANTSDKLKKFFEDKDWKFYCAVAAGLTLAGAGAYYISSSGVSNKKKPESKKEPGK